MTPAGFSSGHATHPGTRRKHNEDTWVDRPRLGAGLGLWAVADGAGGHDAGEVASGMIADALNAIPNGLSRSALHDAVRAAIAATHRALRREAARRGPDTMIASTVVVLLADQTGYVCLWAGDSRVYLLRAGTLRQITRDHSLVQEMVDAGTLTAEEAEKHPHANIITSAVGADDGDLVLDEVSGGIGAGDRFLLCSDGLSKCVPDARLAELMRADDAAAAPMTLIQAALALRATDNVTAVTAAFAGVPAAG